MIKAFVYNIDRDNYKIIQRISKNVLEKEVEIIDITSFRPSFEPGDILLCFGKQTIKYCEHFNWKYMALPDVKELEPGPKNENSRLEAYRKLLKVREDLEKSIQKKVVAESSLPDISDLDQLRNVLNSRGINEWRCNGKDGTEISLSIDPIDSHDVMNITFEELYWINLAMKTLGTRELKFVRRTDPNKDPTSGHTKDNNK